MDAILVLGGAGYVGSHACKALARAGFLPVTVDSLRTGHADAVKWGPLIEADFGDVEAVRAAIRTHGVTAAMHFAAMSLVAEFGRRACALLREERRWHAAPAGRAPRRRRRPRRLLLQRQRLWRDRQIADPGGCAAQPHQPLWRNQAGDRRRVALDRRGERAGWCALRYFNAAGADPDAEIGERHEPETHLIPNILRAVRARQPVKLFGSDYPTPDGSTVRDYVHVSDLADAHVAALRYLADGGASQPMNLGAGAGLSVFQIVAAAERVLGVPIAREMLGRRPGDPASLVADVTRARRLLGFSPRLSDVETLIRTAAAFDAAQRLA